MHPSHAPHHSPDHPPRAPRPAALTRALACTMLATFCVAAVEGAWAAPDAAQRYQAERAACERLGPADDRRACLRDAGAALEAARRGELGNVDAATLHRNARLRCEPLPADQQAACLARMDDEGTLSGSAQAGGLYRELVIVETLPAPATQGDGELQPEAPR